MPVPGRLATRRAVLARQLTALTETMHGQYGNRRVLRAVDFQGRPRVIEVASLLGELRELTRVLNASTDDDTGIAPGPASGAQYDRVRRVLRRREQHEFELELGVPVGTQPESWAEDRASDDEDTAPPGRGEVLADLRQVPMEEPDTDHPWTDTDHVPPDTDHAPPDTCRAWTESVDAPCPEATANREALGMDAFTLSEAARLRELYCRHNFAALQQNALVRRGPSAYDLIPELARLRKAAFEVGIRPPGGLSGRF